MQHKPSRKPGDNDKVNCSHSKEREHGFVSHTADDIATASKVGKADVTANGSFLDERDKLVRESRKRVLERLRVNDVIKNSAELEAKTTTSLDLSRVYALDTAADDFRNVGARVDAECNNRDKNLVDVHRREDDVVNDEELDHHRRAANHGEVSLNLRQ